jgi:hypothetical protein
MGHVTVTVACADRLGVCGPWGVMRVLLKVQVPVVLRQSAGFKLVCSALKAGCLQQHMSCRGGLGQG